MNLSALDFHLPFATPMNPTPEKMLCMAVLQRAILDYLYLSKCLDGKGKPIYHRATATRWFKVKYRGKPPPMSFEWVAEALDLNPSWIRKFLSVAKTNTEAYYKTGFECWYEFFDSSQGPTHELILPPHKG